MARALNSGGINFNDARPLFFWGDFAELGHFLLFLLGTVWIPDTVLG